MIDLYSTLLSAMRRYCLGRWILELLVSASWVIYGQGHEYKNCNKWFCSFFFFFDWIIVNQYYLPIMQYSISSTDFLSVFCCHFCLSLISKVFIKKDLFFRICILNLKFYGLWQKHGIWEFISTGNIFETICFIL